MTSEPPLSSLRSATASRALVTDANSLRACSSRIRPASVRATFRPRRSNRRAPNSRSISATCWERAGWLRCMASAAARKLAALATARNTSNWRSVGCISVPYQTDKNIELELMQGNRYPRPVDVVTYEPGIRLVVFVTAFLLLAGGEALIPRRARSVVRPWRWPTNLTLVALNTLIIRALLPLTAVGMAVVAEQRDWGLLHAVGPIPALLAVPVAIVLLDFAIYLQHVLFHTVPVLWRVHRVHHADIDVDVTTGSRFHPIEIFLSLLNAGSLFDHANLRLSLGLDRVLRLLVVTPDMHRVHHSVLGVETNSNFS